MKGMVIDCSLLFLLLVVYYLLSSTANRRLAGIKPSSSNARMLAFKASDGRFNPSRRHYLKREGSMVDTLESMKADKTRLYYCINPCCQKVGTFTDFRIDRYESLFNKLTWNRGLYCDCGWYCVKEIGETNQTYFNEKGERTRCDTH